LLFTALVALLFAATAQAQIGKRAQQQDGSPSACKMMGGGMMGDISRFSELELTSNQSKTAKELYGAYQRDIYALEDKLITGRRQLQDLLSQTTPDEDKLFAVKKEMFAARNKIAERNLDYQQSVMKLLTKEQKEKLVKLDICPMKGGAMGKGRPQPRGRRHHQR